MEEITQRKYILVLEISDIMAFSNEKKRKEKKRGKLNRFSIPFVIFNN